MRATRDVRIAIGVAVALLAAVLAVGGSVGPALAEDPLVTFDPRQGPGYDDYAYFDETADNQYRSFLRASGVRIIQYAAARVAEEAADWTSGHGAPVGLGDMSEADGAIPGTSVGDPAHPSGAHEDGRDIDVAYYQTGTVDNHLRAVCPDSLGGIPLYQCVDDPDALDAPRTALFLAAVAGTGALRVAVVDLLIRPVLESALEDLCGDGVADACAGVPFTTERFYHQRMMLAFNHTVDNTAPEVTITSPAEGTAVEVGAPLTADYTCSDTGGSGVVACEGDVADGAALDTSTPGSHTLTVTAVDRTRNQVTATRTYTVVAPVRRQADGWVRRSGRAWIGNGTIESAALTQVAWGSAAAGGRVTFQVRVQNDGTAPERLAVRGQSSSGNFIVTYSVPGVAIGSYRTPVLAPNGYRDIGVTVSLRAGTPRGASLARTVTVRSTRDPLRLDVVKVVARRG